jgi:peptide/nickel transport system permease protein
MSSRVATAKEAARPAPADTSGAPLRAALRSALRKPSFDVSVAWLLIVIVATIFASQIAPYSPYAQDVLNTLAMPSGAHLLGTDDVGRDLLSRLLFGGGPLLLGSLESVLVALAIGVPAGLQAGFRAGKADAMFSFVANVVLAVPGFVVLVAVVVITGNNLAVVMAILGILFSANFFKLARASTQATRSLPYVDAARVAGLPRRRILARHILPNITGPLIVQSFITYGVALLIASALAFLGLGLSPLTPSWGQMIFDATQNLYADPWMMVPVGVVLILTILAVNLIGSAVRDGLPHAQRQRLLTVWRTPRKPAVAALASVGVKSDPGAEIEEGPGTRSARPSLDEMPVLLTGDPLLQVEDLVISFPLDVGWHPIVDSVSFTVSRGATLALVGESGCGKTMTGLALMGLVPPPGQITGGRIVLDGEELTGLPESARQRLRGRKVALISQEPMVALDPCFTVGSQLSEALRIHKRLNRRQANEAVLDLLRQMGIARPDAVARSYPHQISGGMAQRVIIALALTGDPELLIADEPTTALDVTIQAEILDLLRSIQEERHMTVIIATHDLGVVADFATEIAVMYAGQIVEQGPAERVLLQPVHPYTRALVGAFPDLTERGKPLPSVEGNVPLPQDWPSWCRFASRCSHALPACLAGPVALTSVRADQAARCVRASEFVKGEQDGAAVARDQRPAG